MIVEPKDVLKLLERAKTSTPKSLQPQLWNLKNCDFVQKPKNKVFGENHTTQRIYCCYRKSSTVFEYWIRFVLPVSNSSSQLHLRNCISGEFCPEYLNPEFFVRFTEFLENYFWNLRLRNPLMKFFPRKSHPDFIPIKPYCNFYGQNYIIIFDGLGSNWVNLEIIKMMSISLKAIFLRNPPNFLVGFLET